MNIKLANVIVYSEYLPRMVISSLFYVLLQINLRRVFRMFAVSTHTCFESWMLHKGQTLSQTYWSALNDVSSTEKQEPSCR